MEEIFALRGNHSPWRKSSPGYERDGKGFKGGTFVALIAILVALILVWTMCFTVQPEETGIVQRFGKVVRTAEPGLHFKPP